jgi:hypothetical protein
MAHNVSRCVQDRISTTTVLVFASVWSNLFHQQHTFLATPLEKKEDYQDPIY